MPLIIVVVVMSAATVAHAQTGPTSADGQVGTVGAAIDATSPNRIRVKVACAGGAAACTAGRITISTRRAVKARPGARSRVVVLGAGRYGALAPGQGTAVVLTTSRDGRRWIDGHKRTAVRVQFSYADNRGTPVQRDTVGVLLRRYTPKTR